MFISVILPCRNEEQTIEKCILQIKECFKKNHINGEIIVSDSSVDNSPNIAKKYEVTLVKHSDKGYGIAIMNGFKKAKGELIIIGDADGTYDFSQIPLFLTKAIGSDLVIGSRLKGKIAKNAMPWHHRFIGNPVLSGLLNLFFKTKISDCHSGFRIIRKNALEKLELKTTGMEFASEMIIKAAKNNMKISEVPINYYPRVGVSKLNSFSDGWRHLRFMLMFSPTYLFLIPGASLLFLGIALTFYKHIFVGELFSIIGFQVALLGLYAKIYSIHTGFEKNDKLIAFIAKEVPLERGILLSILILVIGLFALFFKPDYSMILLVIGFQAIFSIFFISMMLVEKR